MSVWLQLYMGCSVSIKSIVYTLSILQFNLRPFAIKASAGWLVTHAESSYIWTWKRVFEHSSPACTPHSNNSGLFLIQCFCRCIISASVDDGDVADGDDWWDVTPDIAWSSAWSKDPKNVLLWFLIHWSRSTTEHLDRVISTSVTSSQRCSNVHLSQNSYSTL